MRNYFQAINCELFTYNDSSSSDLKLSIKINCSMNFYVSLLLWNKSKMFSGVGVDEKNGNFIETSTAGNFTRNRSEGKIRITRAYVCFNHSFMFGTDWGKIINITWGTGGNKPPCSMNETVINLPPISHLNSYLLVFHFDKSIKNSNWLVTQFVCRKNANKTLSDHSKMYWKLRRLAI